MPPEARESGIHHSQTPDGHTPEDRAPEPAGVLDGLYADADGLDIAAGTAQYAGEAAYLSILRSYALHTPALLETLRAEKRRLGEKTLLRSLTPEDLREYAIAVHGLKGSSYGIKANAVGAAAAALESAAKAGDWEAVRSENDALLEKAETLLARLGEILKTAEARLSESGRPAAAEKERRAAPDPVLLEQLLSAAQRARTSIMEELMAELERCDYDSGADLVVWLRERIENIEYDAVAERLKDAIVN
jgi:HPt (histidine-containing phosphotransfer) domain-containing protein